MSTAPRRLVGHNSPGHMDIGPTGHAWDVEGKPWSYDLAKGQHLTPAEADVLVRKGRVILDP